MYISQSHTHKVTFGWSHYSVSVHCMQIGPAGRYVRVEVLFPIVQWCTVIYYCLQALSTNAGPFPIGDSPLHICCTGRTPLCPDGHGECDSPLVCLTMQWMLCMDTLVMTVEWNYHKINCMHTSGNSLNSPSRIGWNQQNTRMVFWSTLEQLQIYFLWKLKIQWTILQAAFGHFPCI